MVFRKHIELSHLNHDKVARVGYIVSLSSYSLTEISYIDEESLISDNRTVLRAADER